jgi:hypothetical protein
MDIAGTCRSPKLRPTLSWRLQHCYNDAFGRGSYFHSSLATNLGHCPIERFREFTKLETQRINRWRLDALRESSTRRCLIPCSIHDSRAGLK